MRTATLVHPPQAMPHLAVFQRGRAAAAALFAVIDLPPAEAEQATAVASPGPGQPLGDAVQRAIASGQLVPAAAAAAAAAWPPPEAGAVRGELQLVGVSFSYPSRPGRPVFSGLSLAFPAGRQGRQGGEATLCPQPPCPPGCWQDAACRRLPTLLRPSARPP